MVFLFNNEMIFKQTEEGEGAAMYILLDGYDTMGIGYIALWGFGAKSGTG